ncbi:hypothetical protein QBC34DRAFT_146409 [Podospora aff. communis PSN243]|uniref:Uncharacterized protein n=1 Tax=Podospora aff. communis PSN243 TaxID=3040156 RepID=A0AAV9GEI7_9PEZI|nr:hypothetical protein QBC34DRAFT_146409 [Podospora aff. communis PSN243]
MVSGLAKAPIILEIHPFQPNPDDRLSRQFLDDRGVPKEVLLPPYCLPNIEKTSVEFEAYVNENAFDGLLEAVKEEHGIIRRTFEMIVSYYNGLPDIVTVKRKHGEEQHMNEHKELLLKSVRLWFAIRHGIGTSKVDGNRPKGLEPIYTQGSPFAGEVPAMPRMIVAQFDSIRHERIYKMEAWFTGYLVTFLLLDLIGSASRDRQHYAYHNSGGKRPETRYGAGELAKFVEDLHWAGSVMLMYWHYFKRVDLLDMQQWRSPKAKALKWLKPEELDFVKQTVLELRPQLATIPITPKDGCWESSMFWVSQMFRSTSSSDYKWAPPEIFAREKPSVGRESDFSCCGRKPKFGKEGRVDPTC